MANQKGDILVRQANNVLDRLPVGTEGQYLTTSSGADSGVAWTTNSTVTTVTGTTVTGTVYCILDLEGRSEGIYTYTKTADTIISVINGNTTIAGGCIVGIYGGAETVSYPVDWKEIGGTAMTVTTSGTDRWLITWEDFTDATTYKVSQTLDWKAS